MRHLALIALLLVPAAADARPHRHHRRHHAAQPTPLPGEYIADLGDPLVHVENRLDGLLTVVVTDSSGVAETLSIDAGSSQDVTLMPGTFTFTAYAGLSSLAGSHVVDADYEYEWEFAPQ
jgi:hypothetical protein